MNSYDKSTIWKYGQEGIRRMKMDRYFGHRSDWDGKLEKYPMRVRLAMNSVWAHVPSCAKVTQVEPLRKYLPINSTKVTHYQTRKASVGIMTLPLYTSTRLYQNRMSDERVNVLFDNA